MQRSELEHLIRAAASITNEYEMIIIGSQAILGTFPHAPAELLQSTEADIYPRHAPEKSELIEGSIGEDSVFADHYGYYAQGIGPETALLPPGWEGRLVKIQSAVTDLKIGWCLEPHDLAASKLAAGREKDREFIAAVLQHGLVERRLVSERIDQMALPAEHRQRMSMMLLRIEREVNESRQAGHDAHSDTDPSGPGGG